MDRGRAARGGQKPTTPTTRLIKGYSRINAYYATRLDLRSMSEIVRATITRRESRQQYRLYRSHVTLQRLRPPGDAEQGEPCGVEDGHRSGEPLEVGLAKNTSRPAAAATVR